MHHAGCERSLFGSGNKFTRRSIEQFVVLDSASVGQQPLCPGRVLIEADDGSRLMSDLAPIKVNCEVLGVSRDHRSVSPSLLPALRGGCRRFKLTPTSLFHNAWP